MEAIHRKEEAMRTLGKIGGWTLIGAGYLYCFVMLWMSVIQWWGWSAVWAFIFSPVLALFIPLIFWIVEGAFPVLYFAGWGAITLGAIIMNFASKD